MTVPAERGDDVRGDGTQTGIQDSQGIGGQGSSGVIYGVEDVPPLYLCILLGLQHYLTMFGSTITVPLVLYTSLCMDEDIVGLSEVISTMFFMCGIATLLQTTFGVRLPIVQGGTFAFLVPTFSILQLDRWKCDYIAARKEDPLLENSTLPDPGSEEHREMWQARIREIQGAIIAASVFQLVIGFTGLVGIILKFIGPLAIIPTITLIGIALFKEAADKASAQWYIAFMTMFLIALFSQYLRNVTVPCLTLDRTLGCKTIRLPVFALFPVLFAMIGSWIICVILTAAGAFSDDPQGWGYNARTDIKTDVLYESQWFRFPYPGQWGTPTFNTGAIFGMLAGVLASMIESIGDYYACARLAGAPPPPIHAINRGICVEGIGCILAGAWGSGNGVTSYSENIGAIGITKVGSRRVVQVGGCIMIVLGCLGKFGALFVTIPDPVVGGMFMVMFGMVTAVGLSNIQFIDVNSPRNIFILGVSLFFGLSFPKWMASHDAINTGSETFDQIASVLLGTSMFVGGMMGLILDNTIPGTPEERGIHIWRQQTSSVDVTSGLNNDIRIYDLPFIQKYLDRYKVFKYLPFCPGFSFTFRRRGKGDKEKAKHGFEAVAVTSENTESNIGHENSTVPQSIDTRF